MQNVSICQLNATTYTIQCTYLNGSDSRGCVFVLVSREEEVEDITGTIPRSNRDGVAIELSDIMDFNVVLAFDLEEGNAISTVPLSVTIGAATSVCPTAGMHEAHLLILLVEGLVCENTSTQIIEGRCDDGSVHCPRSIKVCL